MQTEFVDLISSRLSQGGVLHMATDWHNYAEHMVDVMQTRQDFQNLAESPPYSPRPDTRPLTKFENRGLRLGHGVWDLLYQKR